MTSGTITTQSRRVGCGTIDGNMIARQANPAEEPVADLLVERSRATWNAGAFGRIAATYAPSAREFVDRLKLGAGERVLDVACGNGNLAIPAAKAGARVVGIDIVPSLIEQACMAAKAEGLDVSFDVGNAEALPYADDAFDTVMTMFGAMFAPRPERATAELLRVVRPGGRIAMANWVSDGFVGRMLSVVGAHVPPPPGQPSTLLWGDERTVRERLVGASSITFQRRHAVLAPPVAPKDAADYFFTWYGPTVRAYAALDESGRASLRDALTKLWVEHNRATDGTTAVHAEYLEVIAIR